MNLHQSPLFYKTNIDTSQFQIKRFPSHYILEIEGAVSTYVGIVLEGSLIVTSYTVSGNPIHISTLKEGQIYGDILIFGSKTNCIPGNIMSQSPCMVAMIPNEIVEDYLLHNPQFLKNFLALISDKVYSYSMSSKLLSQDTLRDKILFFLKEEMIKQQSNVVQLEMTKQELAEKLHVQRPSLSRELIHMREAGLIEFNRWTITLKIDK